jgi:hypothetical protein
VIGALRTVVDRPLAPHHPLRLEISRYQPVYTRLLLRTSDMGGPLRSKHGCWTCRLRKKKCDEVRPHCATCASLTITCYGYGSKPDWMDNGEKEKAIANSLRETVKHTSRRKAPSSTQRDPNIRIAPKSSNSYVEDPPVSSGSSSQHGAVISPLEHGSSQQGGVSALQEPSTVSMLI